MQSRLLRFAGIALVLVLVVVAALLNGRGQTEAPQPTIARQPTGTAVPAAAQAATVTPGTTSTRAAPTATQRAVPSSTATAQAARNTPTATTAPRAQPTPTTIKTNDGLPIIQFARLPAEAQETIRLIDQGGPFPYDRDGIVFGNRERLLPLQAEGYYHEYTVITPGSADRGARRVITGQRGEFYYTDDHYESFKRVQR